MSETSELVGPTIRALTQLGIWCWRNNAGKRGGVQMAPTGSPDILGVLPGGVLFGLEAKAPGKKPTQEQIQWGHRLVALGGYYGVFWDKSCAIDAVLDWRRQCQSRINSPTASLCCAPDRASRGSSPSKAKSVRNVELECTTKSRPATQHQRSAAK